MGSWGFSALADDMALDVYESFIEAYDQGADPLAVRDALIADVLQEAQQTGEELPFRLGLAKALWECGVLTKGDVSELEDFVRSEAAMEGFADPADRKRRRIALDRFFKKLSVPKTKPRARPKQQARPIKPLFDPGTCLAISLGDMVFGGVVVVQSKYDTPKVLWYRLVLLRQLFDHLPAMEYFCARDWLMEDRSAKREEVRKGAAQGDFSMTLYGGCPEHWLDRPWPYWCSHRELKSNADSWAVVGTLGLDENDPLVPDDRYVGEYYHGFDSVIETLRRRGAAAPIRGSAR